MTTTAGSVRCFSSQSPSTSTSVRATDVSFSWVERSAAGQPQKPGHVPTTVNVPWSRAAAEDGTFRSDEELRALYADAGVDLSGERDTVVYCRIGERSAHTWFVLRELLGRPRVRNYDGSWVEYGSLVGAPIEK